MSNPAEISQIMANAKKMIEEKKAQLGINVAAKTTEDKKAAILALKAKIAAASSNIEQNFEVAQMQQKMIAPQSQEQQQQTQEERDRSLNLIIDSEGRTIDRRTGELVQIQSRLPTLKANILAKKRDITSRLKRSADSLSSGITSTISGMSTVFTDQAGIESTIVGGEKTVATDDTQAQTELFFDPRLKLKTAERNKRKLTFNDKGIYVDLANKLRTKSKLKQLQQDIASISKKTGISSDSRLALIQPKRISKETIPNIEWWDFAVLNEVNYDCLNNLNDLGLIEKIKINRLIEHPVQMKPPTQSDKRVTPAVMLTAKERKKMRRQNRSEALKEEQEKVRLGLALPPEPKVKISNLMRVLGTEAVQDPTKVEEYVRNQMAKRQKMHEESNASRKLTDEERGAKKKRKIMEDTEDGVNVSVFRVKDLTDPATKFKLEANCNQLHMTGTVLLLKNLNVVIVEGGPKQTKKFRRLMLNRIRWNDLKIKEGRNDASNIEEREPNSCSLVWEGMVKNRNFGAIIFKSCPTVTFAREYFKKLGCEHYWDIAQTDAILQQAD